MDSFRISKRVLCNFLIENNNPELGKLVSHLQNEYTINTEHIEVVSDALNRYFFQRNGGSHCT